MAEPNDDGAQKPSRQVARLEWAVAALGVGIVAAVLATLTQEHFAADAGEPVLVARVLAVTPTAGGYVVRFRAANDGPETAAEVTFAATLTAEGRTVEEAEVTLDYVARKSSREAAIVFRRDPGTATLAIAATSFRKP